MGANILLAEQDSNLRNTLSFELKKREYRVMPASNGEKALEAAEAGSYDIIIANADLPAISGFDLITRLASLKIVAPVILTSSDLELDQKEIAKFRAAALIKKPFGITKLVELVEKVLKK